MICQKCSFSSECYCYKYVDKVNGRDSYILQRHCVEHCQFKECPHRDEASVELIRVIPPPDYSHLVHNGGPSKMADIHQQSTGTQHHEGRKTPIPGDKASTSIVPRISKKDRSRPKGLLATKRAKGTRGSRRGSGQSRRERTKYLLSARTVIATGSTHRPGYRGMKRGEGRFGRRIRFSQEWDCHYGEPSPDGEGPYRL